LNIDGDVEIRYVRICDQWTFKIRGSHILAAEATGLLGCEGVFVDKCFRTIRRSIVASSTESGNVSGL